MGQLSLHIAENVLSLAVSFTSLVFDKPPPRLGQSTLQTSTPMLASSNHGPQGLFFVTSR